MIINIYILSFKSSLYIQNPSLLLINVSLYPSLSIKDGTAYYHIIYYYITFYNMNED
jgi:hypothetical protein